MLILCSTQLGGTETEAETLTSLCPPHYDNPHGLHSHNFHSGGERDVEYVGWVWGRCIGIER